MVRTRGRALSHALNTAGLALALGLGATPLAGCGDARVEARAVWIDGLTGEDLRRVQVYDRGTRYDFEVLGETGPKERVRLGPRGRGLLIRAGDRRGAWFDLDDGRRLPLLLPESAVGGEATVQLGTRGDVLWWLEDPGQSLHVVALVPGFDHERRSDGTVVPLVEAGPFQWALGARDAPILLVARGSDGLEFLRYPDGVGSARGSAPGLIGGAAATGLGVPDAPRSFSTCTSATDCYSTVGLAAGGERAIVTVGKGGPWFELDARAPQLAGELVLPEVLADAVPGGLGLLQVFDAEHSAWLGAGQLHHWDRARGTVESVPVFATPPLAWFSVARGRALVLVAVSGPTYRVDADGVEIVSLETTPCALAPGSAPVISPAGRFAAWTCLDEDAEFSAASGVVVRVSELGLERHAGVPMSPVAIDDAGALLLVSTESIFTDTVDGVAPTSRPRSLFSLSRDGVLTRVDELEPAPTPVLLGSSDVATYIQGAALEPEP